MTHMHVTAPTQFVEANGIRFSAGAHHFEAPGAQNPTVKHLGNGTVHTTFQRTDKYPERPRGNVAAHLEAPRLYNEVRAADLGWYKQRLSDVAMMISEGRTEEARLYAKAVAGLPKNLRPTDFPYKTEELIRQRIEEEKARAAEKKGTGVEPKAKPM